MNPRRRWTSVGSGSGSLPSSLGLVHPVKYPSDAIDCQEFCNESNTKIGPDKPSKQSLLTKFLWWKKVTKKIRYRTSLNSEST